MKKYFIIKDPTIEAQYDEAISNEEIMRQAFVQMKEEYGISTKEFYLSRERFYIVYDHVDREKFRDQMTQGGEFKKASAMNKRWLELLKEKGITKVAKPHLALIIDHDLGRCGSTMFKIDEVLYGSFETNGNFIDLPEGWVELKASEYYKILEDHEAKLKGGQQ